MSVLTLEAKLERAEPTTPWGFRMQGGKDFHSPLTIQKVNAGSLAAKCGLLAGDILLKIGNHSTDVLLHKEAQNFILNSGNRLDLLLQRIRSKRPSFGGTPVETKFSTPTISSYQSPGSGSPFGQNYNAAPKPFGSAGGPAGHGPGVDNITQKTQNISFKPPSSGPPPPPPAPPAPPPFKTSPPKPAVWSPQKSAGQTPAAKPFNPAATAPPSAPAAPRAPPLRPTGQGSQRGKKGDAVFQPEVTGGSARVPVCASCGSPIRGPFVMAMGKSWCPDHFVCANPRCGIKLLDIGFVEEGGFLYCEKDYEMYFAPKCSKCSSAIIGECVNALNQTWHPQCFLCYHCKQPIGGGEFHLEDNNPYCNADWNKLFQTMCFACSYPIEPGDKWVEAMNNNFHSECFNCQTCQVNLEGQPFYSKGGNPYCKKHAR